MGIPAYLQQQFDMPETVIPMPNGNSMGELRQWALHNYSSAPDQLRQRVAYALSQIVVTSADKLIYPDTMLPWLRLLSQHAFGNYRDLLRDVSMSPSMGNTGMSRQVFICILGGFDTHASQSRQHWSLLHQVSDALAAFYNATIEMGIPDRVTSFTLSDFGRSLQPSGSGSDHGWGNHHLILGGGVQGGKMYGTFPTMALGGPDDSGSRGAFIPTTSTDQYGATLAAWLGVPNAQLPSVFPNIGKFGTSNLGFMG